MELDAARKEIEELKSAMEKLTAEYTVKSELSERLRRAHDEQLTKFKEAKKEIDKQTQELQIKSEEISLAKKTYEDLQSNLHKKELVVKCLTSTNNQLRNSSSEKLMNLERQNRELASALDEANFKVEGHEKKVNDYKEEVAGLRNLFSDSQKRCLEAEKKAQAFKVLRGQEETLIKLEQECDKTGEQLKWKNEQFKHLEEAYKKLQDQFHAAKLEWKEEKCSLVDEICSLQRKLESQTRMVEDLNSRLKMCNQALAHEESQRKMLEIQVLESRASYENVVTEYEEVRSKFEKLTEKRNEDIAAVRNLLASKETLLKEMGFCNTRLQQDNDELQASLKEFQLGQINEVGAATALKNLRHKFKNLEQAHRDCLANLKAKETRWSSRVENLENDLDAYLRKLGSEQQKVLESQLKLEECLSSMMQLKLENDEMSVIIIMFQSRISELSSEDNSYTDDVNEVAFELKHWKSAAEQANKFKLDAEVEMKTLRHECDNNRRDLEVALLAKLRSEMDFEKEKLNFVQEIGQKDRKVEVLQEEVIQFQNVLAEQQLEAVARGKLESMTAFDKERESFQKIAEEKDKIVESFRKKLQLLVQECARVKAEVDVLQKEIVQLQKISAQQWLEAVAHAKLEAMTAFDKERENFQKVSKEKDKTVERLDEKFKLLEQECARTKAEVVITLQEEKASFLNINKQKDLEIADLQKHILSQEQLSRSVETAITSQLAEMQFELDALYESWEKIVAAHFLDMYEKEFKNAMRHELEEEQTILKLKLELEEKQSSDLKKYLKELENEMEKERLKRKVETVRIGDELERMQLDGRELENQIIELNSSLKEMQEDNRLLISDRENLVAQIVEFSSMLGKVCCEKGKLMEEMMLMERMENMEYKREDLFDVNKLEQSVDLGYKGPASRSPMKEQNNNVSKFNVSS